jgi:hypothetical protein
MSSIKDALILFRLTVNINGKTLANPNLLAFAYVVSLLEGENPAESH